MTAKYIPRTFRVIGPRNGQRVRRPYLNKTIDHSPQVRGSRSRFAGSLAAKEIHPVANYPPLTHTPQRRVLVTKHHDQADLHQTRQKSFALLHSGASDAGSAGDAHGAVTAPAGSHAARFPHRRIRPGCREHICLRWGKRRVPFTHRKARITEAPTMRGLHHAQRRKTPNQPPTTFGPPEPQHARLVCGQPPISALLEVLPTTNSGIFCDNLWSSSRVLQESQVVEMVKRAPRRLRGRQDARTAGRRISDTRLLAPAGHAGRSPLLVTRLVTAAGRD
jgi:hypothetical protein